MQHWERPVMKPGEILVLVILIVCVGGVGVTAFTPGLDMTIVSGRTDNAGEDGGEPPNPIDLLSSGCSGLIYGNLPRQSFSGDTTILTMDLDIAAYTVTQANLTITRLLRRCGITLLETRQRSEGGLTFIAVLPDGLPLRMELKAPI